MSDSIQFFEPSRTSNIHNQAMTPRTLSIFLLLPFIIVGFFASPAWGLPPAPNLELGLPSPLTGWDYSGPALQTGSSDTILLPAKSELSYPSSEDQLAIRVVSTPYFSELPEGLPSLEVGPASLAFTRSQQGGAMVLLGNQQVLLPFFISLADDGRSTKVLDIVLAYDRSKSLATLSVDGLLFTAQAKAREDVMKIAVTPGADAGWYINHISTLSYPIEILEDVGGRYNDYDGVVTSQKSNPASDKEATSANVDGESVAEALRLCKSRDFARAEEVLKSGIQNSSAAQSISSLAVKLTHLAFSLRQMHDYAGAAILAQRAIDLLEESAVDSYNDEKPARPSLMTAYIKKNLLSDSEGALRDYRAVKKIRGVGFPEPKEFLRLEQMLSAGPQFRNYR